MPIRYEDDQLAVVAKPAGLVTHPTAARRGGTLVNRLLGMGVPLAPAGGAPARHRASVGCRDLGSPRRREDRRGLRRSAVCSAGTGRAPATSPVRGSVGHDAFSVDAPLGRRASKDRGGRHGGTPGRDTVRGAGAASTAPSSRPCRGRVARIDPRAPGVDRPSDRRGSRLRGRGRRRPQSRPRPAVPARGHLSFAPARLGDGRARGRAPGGPRSALHRPDERRRLTAPGGDVAWAFHESQAM